MKYQGNAKSDPGSVFPEGEYFLTCVHVQDKDKDGVTPLTSKKSGNDMWHLEFNVHEGEFKDRKVWHYLVFIPAGKPGHGMPLACLKAFGINPEGDNDILPEHLLNATVKARVGIEQDKDQEYPPKNVVKKWFAAPELRSPAQVDAAEAAAGSAQEPDPATEFDPKKLEAQAATSATKASTVTAPAPAKKKLWGK